MADTAELSERDLLEEVEVLRRRQLETGVALLGLVSEFARQHGAEHRRRGRGQAPRT